MSAPANSRPVATLWNLSWNRNSIACNVYRTADGALQLIVESPAAVIVSETFDLAPRAVARVRSLRESLMQRGWRDAEE
jgi:hypothetical protein